MEKTQTIRPVRTIRIIWLIGMPGAGKSTAGPILAESLTKASPGENWEFIDTDLLLEAIFEQRTGTRRKTPQIFEQEGEELFRETEEAILKDLVKKNQEKTGQAEQNGKAGMVIATGGGTLEHLPSLRIMNSAAQGISIHLDASPETLLARGASRRPKTRTWRNLREFMRVRGEAYRAIRDIHIRTDGQSPEETAREACRNVQRAKTQAAQGMDPHIQ